MKGEVRRGLLLNFLKINVITVGSALLWVNRAAGLLRLFLRLLHLFLGLPKLITHSLGGSADGENHIKHQPVGHI